jgi:ATP-binding cassette subfamily F protein 3
MLKILADFAPDSGSIAQEKKWEWDFCVRILILSKEEQYLRKYEAFVDIKIVEKKLEEINHLLWLVRTMKVMSIAKL